MKDFYRVCKTGDINSVEYFNNKRNTVLETIKPICEAVGITDYDYEIEVKKLSETLVVEGTRIGCTCNSIGATVRELIVYIFIGCGGADKIHNFRKPVLNDLMRCWKKEKQA